MVIWHLLTLSCHNNIKGVNALCMNCMNWRGQQYFLMTYNKSTHNKIRSPNSLDSNMR